MIVKHQPDLIVLISGKAGAGKTTFAKALSHRLAHHGASSTVLPLAEALKLEAATNGWNGEKDVKGRTLLQTIGECRRTEDIDYWCKKVSDRIDVRKWDAVIIDDLRYRSELAYFQNNYSNVVPIRLVRYRDGQPYDNGLTAEQKAHISEIDLDNANFYVKYDIEEGLQKNYHAVGSFFFRLLTRGWYDKQKIGCKQ